MTSAGEMSAWDALPAEEARSVWDETERNFWANQQRLYDAADREADKKYHQSLTEVKVDLSRLNSRRGFLAESQARLSEELSKVEEELARVVKAFEEKAEHMNKIEEEHRDGLQARLENQQKVRRTMRQFFRDKRGEEASLEEEDDFGDDGFAPPAVWAAEVAARRPQVNGDADEAPSIVIRDEDELVDGGTSMRDVGATNGSHGTAADVMANVVDADGNYIGSVERIEPWNQWVEAIEDLEIRRDIKIRRGRRFNESHLASIYERTEAKGVKWLSCMIQATGEIQTKRCHSCEKNQGAFDDCIIVGGELFQKCGNCEWNRQGCHGASNNYIDLDASRDRRRQLAIDAYQAVVQRDREGEKEGSPEADVTEPIDGIEQERIYEEARRMEAKLQEERMREAEVKEARVLEARAQEVKRKEVQDQVDARLREEARREEAERQARRQEAQEAQRQEARRQEAQRQEAQRQDAERQEAERQEAERQEALRQEAQRQEAQQEARRQEAREQEAQQQEAKQQGAPQQEAKQQEATQQEATQQERQHAPAATLPPLPLALPPQAPPSSLPSRPAQPAQADRAQPSTEFDTPTKDAQSVKSNASREPEQMPTPQEYRVTPGFTPANAQRSRPPSADRPTPTSMHIEPSPQPTETSPTDDLDEITRDMLSLRHNGTTYIYPDCVDGVPLEKIHEDHPYWEPNWPNVRALIEPQLAKWREKHAAAIEAGPKGDKGGSSKYQIGRQVNRGVKILEFLEEGDISPYQLLAKKYITSGKGGICSYDTLFRLSETMSELAKFKLDIKPIEWMRQRLHELIQVEGPTFNLPRTIHDFYHDPKLTSLRFKHGFKNIGRPSGIKSMRHCAAVTPKPIKKRKSMHSLTGTPRDSPYGENSPLANQVSTPSVPKRVRLSPPVLPASVLPGSITDGYRDEFHFLNHTDTESWSGAAVGKNDFQLKHVKTRRYTSTASVTQYWTWQEDNKMFEHQVLKALSPVQWGIHRQPFNFHLGLDEITKLVWNIDALRIHVVLRKENDTQGRGDIMAEFKRENTMRRFLNFCRTKDIPLSKDSM